jgi:HPt (histidine-containing phosphotransfer) domain-containing protein
MSTSTQPTSVPPLGYALLCKRCLGQPSLVRQVLDRFADSLASELDLLEKCYVEKDLAQLAASAHRLKGACLNVAARPLAEHLARLELEAAGGNGSELDSLMEQIRREGARLTAYVDRLRYGSDSRTGQSASDAPSS